MSRRHRLLILLILFAGTSVWAVAEPAGEEEALQQRTLEALRKHPEHLAMLRENLQAFNAASESRKNAIIKLDQDLEQTTGKKKKRLWNALTRYADWLDDLRKSNLLAYEAIKAAPDADTRLALIKEQRDREWLETQPKKYREEWEKLKGDARVAYVLKRRKAERVKQNQWVIAKLFWTELESKQPMPCRLADFVTKEKGKGSTEVNKVKDYVVDYLLPYISDEQKKQLADAEGRWPEYPQTLVEIARRRPSALPVKGEKLPTKLADLPRPIQPRVLQKGGGKKKLLLPELNNWEGREQFVSKVVEFAAPAKKGSAHFEFEFWARDLSSLDAPMQNFVMKTLTPRLDPVEKNSLIGSEGRWPAYPERIQELSKKYNLQPPWHYLPDPDHVWKWELYRNPRAQSWGIETVKEKDAPRPTPLLDKERAVRPNNSLPE